MFFKALFFLCHYCRRVWYGVLQLSVQLLRVETLSKSQGSAVLPVKVIHEEMRKLRIYNMLTS